MSAATASEVDFDKFRLHRLVERLVEAGEVEVHEAPVSLADLSRLIEAVGSRDGREIMLELVEMRQAGKVHRLENGAYARRDAADG